MKKHLFYLFVTLLAAFISSVGLWVFVYPANFAPAGVDGIATMLQDATHFNAGYYSLFINIPLLILAWFVLDRRYVIYTLAFTVFSSGLLILFEAVSFPQYMDVNENGYLISAIFSGVLLGARTGILLKIGTSSGGVDIVSCIIQKKTNYDYVERIITIFCYITIGISYFYYHDLNAILLSIVQMFVFDRVAASVLKEKRNAIEFKIITSHPDEIKEEIVHTLKHGATIISCTGAYTDTKHTMICTVVNNRQITEFNNLLKKYDDTFIYYSDVLGVKGNFRFFKDDEVK